MYVVLCIEELRNNILGELRPKTFHCFSNPKVELNFWRLFVFFGRNPKL